MVIKGEISMSIEVGEEIIIPFKPKDHVFKTGTLCRVNRICESTIYVTRFDVKKQDWGSNLHTQIDRKFLENLKKTRSFEGAEQ